jgi:hypothetical protein
VRLVFDTKFSCETVDLIQSVLHLTYHYVVFPLRCLQTHADLSLLSFVARVA